VTKTEAVAKQQDANRSSIWVWLQTTRPIT